MSNGLNKTKRRISSITSTEKTTKAMELIATVKLKRFLLSYTHEKNYSAEFLELMGELFAHDKETASHYAKVNQKAPNSLYIVITSDLGLCGGYNSSLFKFVASLADKDDVVAPLGNKGINHYARSQEFANVTDDYSSIGLSTDLSVIHSFCQNLKDDFNAGKYKKIVVVYTRYINSISSIPSSFQLFPVQVPHKAWTHEEYCPPEFDVPPRTMIHTLLPSYLTSVIYNLLVESQLSEQSSRRNAMDNANDNADSLLDKLRIEYNKARQNAITQEITEVVGGSQQ